MTAQELLTTITLACSGWTLLQVIAHGKKLAAIEQRVKDLPCPPVSPCGPVNIK